MISYFASDDVPIILLTLIDKGERADISPSDRITIKDLLGRFADEYRRGVIRGIHSRQRIETE